MTKLYNFISIFLLLTLVSGTAKANGDELDRWLKETVSAHNMAGLTAVVVRDGDVIFNKSYGTIDKATNAQVTPSHMFHMASVSKPLVAIAIMQLVEAGQVELSAPVTDYLPYFVMRDERLAGVTIERLLAHTAGMPDVSDYEWTKPQSDAAALERWVKDQAGKSLLFHPGESREYSNIGYEVLGAVIAKVSGQTFEAYMKDNILLPLGMSQSSFLRVHIPDQLRVRGHLGTTVAVPLDHYPYNRRHAPSSTFHTNGNEFTYMLKAFASPAAFVASGLLKPESIEKLWSVQYEMADDWKMTLGWFWHMTDEGGVLRHGGGDDGFRSEMAVMESENAAYGMMMNRSEGPLADIRLALRRAATGKPLPPIPTDSVVLKAAHAHKVLGIESVVTMFKEMMDSSRRREAYSVYTYSVDLMLKGNLETALELAQGFRTVSPDHPLILSHLASIYLKMGDQDQARVMAEAALKQRPGFAEATSVLNTLEF